jgi:hypothetical protein
MKLREPMKISDKTISLLKNFSNINQSLMFKTGNQIRTISVMKNIFAEATISESIPKNFGIYDLNQFLNGISLHPDPELVFNSDSHLVIKGGGNTTKYYFADPSIIVTPPEKTLNLPSEDVCFNLSSEQLDKLIKAASVYGLEDISVIGDGSTVNLLVRDKENSSSNEFSINVGETESTFVFNFKVENMKILPGKYEVVVSAPQMARFSNTAMDLVYYIALEPDSTFG